MEQKILAFLEEDHLKRGLEEIGAIVPMDEKAVASFIYGYQTMLADLGFAEKPAKPSQTLESDWVKEGRGYLLTYIADALEEANLGREAIAEVVEAEEKGRALLEMLGRTHKRSLN
mgnify:FL=1